MAVNSDVDNYVTKFMKLAYLGYDAQLIITCVQGHLSINIQQSLVPWKPPTHYQHHYFRHEEQHCHHRRKHSYRQQNCHNLQRQQPTGAQQCNSRGNRAGPSRLRRREKRAHARAEAAEEPAEAAQEPAAAAQEPAAAQYPDLPTPPPAEILLSSFRFKPHPSLTTMCPTSPKRRVLTRRPRRSRLNCSDPLKVTIRPQRYVKGLQTMNIERATENSAGGRGTWIHEVCLVAATNATRAFLEQISTQQSVTDDAAYPPSLVKTARIPVNLPQPDAQVRLSSTPEQGEENGVPPEHQAGHVAVPYLLRAAPPPQAWPPAPVEQVATMSSAAALFSYARGVGKDILDELD